MLALVYFASVVVLQALLRTVTGQQQSELVTVISTLGIAARFAQLTTICIEPNCATTQLTAVEATALQQIGVPLTLHTLYYVTLESLFMLVYTLIAFIIFWHRSDDGFAIFISLTLVTFGALVTAPIRTLETSNLVVSVAVHTVQVIGWASFLTFLYLFPSGQFVPRLPYIRPLTVIAWLLAWLIWPFVNVFAWPLPLSVLMFVVWVGSGALAQLYRYQRISTPPQRQQTKWVVFGFVGAAIGAAILVAPLFAISSLAEPGLNRLMYDAIGILIFAGSLLLIPVSIGFSILRYRLWDIDILIRRTLIYSSLTVLLLLLYFANVIVLQTLLRFFSAQQPSELVTVISTLILAAVVAPLRWNAQTLIDRRFYRHKYDAAKALAAFAAEGGLVAQVQSIDRATDSLYEFGTILMGGARRQEENWTHVLTRLAERLGVQNPSVEMHKVCVDPRRQWREARNIWKNASVRTVL